MSSQPWKRIVSFRFSLRTLLLLFTAASIWMGMEAKWAADQKRAVEWIAENSGTVVYDSAFESPLYLKRKPSQQSDQPNWLSEKIGKHFIERPIFVYLDFVELDDAAIAHLSALTKLRYISFTDTYISPDTLDRLHRALPLAHIVHPDAPYLGLGDVALSPDQCVVTVFAQDSPAQEAGVKNGDIVVELAGKRVRNFGDLRRIVSRCEPNSIVKMKVIRADKPLSIDIATDTWEKRLHRSAR